MGFIFTHKGKRLFLVSLFGGWGREGGLLLDGGLRFTNGRIIPLFVCGLIIRGYYAVIVLGM